MVTEYEVCAIMSPRQQTLDSFTKTKDPYLYKLEVYRLKDPGHGTSVSEAGFCHCLTGRLLPRVGPGQLGPDTGRPGNPFNTVIII